MDYGVAKEDVAWLKDEVLLSCSDKRFFGEIF